MDNYFENQIERLVEKSEWLTTQYSSKEYQCGFINGDKTILFAFSDNHNIILEGFINKDDKSIVFADGILVERLKNTSFNDNEQFERLFERLNTLFAGMNMNNQLNSQKISEENVFRPHVNIS